MKTLLKRTIVILLIVFSTTIIYAQKNTHKNHNKVGNISFNNFSGAIKIQDGFWTATKEGDIIHIQLMNSRSSNGSFFINFSVEENQFEKNTSTSFLLKRASGTMTFNGQFPQHESTGKFTFNHNKDFERFLNGKVLRSVSKNEDYYLFKLFLGNATRSYVNSIQEKGYKPTLKQLGKLVIHEVSLAYIDALDKTNYRNLELDMLIKFAIHDISIDYLNALDKVGYGSIDAQMVKKFAIHDISINYIKALSSAGYGDLEANMLKKFAVHDISPQYIKSLLATKIYKPDANSIKKAKIHGVSANFIREARGKGLNSQDLSYYIKAKVKGINETKKREKQKKTR